MLKQALRITSIYLVLSVVWILFSDYIVLSRDFAFLSIPPQTLKGLTFVILTSGLIYILIDRFDEKQQALQNASAERNEALKKMTDQYETYKQVIEQMPSGVILIDPSKSNHPILYANNAFENITGHNKDDLIGKTARLIGHPTDNQEIEVFDEAISSGETLEITLPSYKKDGTFYWNYIKLSPVYNKAQELIYYMGILSDVTEHEEQRRLIQTQLDMFEHIFIHDQDKDLFTGLANMMARHLQADTTVMHWNDKIGLNVYASDRIPYQMRHLLESIPEDHPLMHQFINNQMTDQNSLIDRLTQELESQGFAYEEIWLSPIYSETKQHIIGMLIAYFQPGVTRLTSDYKAYQHYQSMIGVALQKTNYLDHIRESEQMYRLIADYSSDMVLLLNKDKKTEYYSPSFSQLSDQPMTYNLFMHRLSQQSKHEFYSFLTMVEQSNKPIEVELIIKNKCKQLSVIEVKGHTFIDENDQQEKILLNARDITDRKKFEDALNKSLYIDHLTQLPNRFRFKQLLEEKSQVHTRNSIVVCQFIALKNIRTLYSVAVVEEILKQVSERLETIESIQIIAKTNEDTFTCLVNIGHDRLSELIETTVESLSEPWLIDGLEIIIPVAAGASFYQEQPIDQWINEAEQALNEATQDKGRRYVIFSHDITEHQQRYLALQNDLYHAVTNEELVIYYQPIVDVSKTHIYGFEALLRWEHPSYGLVMPYEFIPIAEATGVIVEIGYWVIEQACKKIKQWEQENEDFSLSVNISYRQLEASHFLERVEALLKAGNCPSDHLVFEITESILMKDIVTSNQVLTALKALGIRISVDDFGIGYSSLSYLKKFPVDILKIDRAFIKNIDEDNNDAAIVSAIMDMSRALALDVVAEGIETKKHLEWLTKFNCHYMQGYLYSRPVSEKDLPQVISDIRKFLITS